MNKVYAFSDIHGMYELWEQIKEYCDDSDVIYFLGDAADRGPHGHKIMRELLTDKRVFYLLGNHDEFLLHIGADLIEGHNSNIMLWIANGGHPTIQDFLRQPIAQQEWILRKLNQLHRKVIYVNKNGQILHLSHAGQSLDEDLELLRLKGEDIENLLIWDRQHIQDPWPQDEEYQNQYVIHGHTPTKSLAQFGAHITEPPKIGVPGVYANGHKIDIDTGCFASGSIPLFDLDELKVAKIFTIKTKEEEK